MTARELSSILAVSFCFSLFLAPVRAADFSKVDLSPWLRIRESRYDFALPPLSGAVEGFTDSNVLITKGGGIFLEASTQTHPVGEPAPFETLILRGVATRAERSRFSAAVDKMKPGIQGDCILLSNDERFGDRDIIWYGRGGRRQQFQIYLRAEIEGSLPLCSKEVADFLIAVESLLSAVGSHRDTETLSTPPL